MGVPTGKADAARSKRSMWVLGGALLTLVLAGCASEARADTQVSPSVFVTEEEPLVRMHEAPSVLIDADDPETVYVGGVDLANGTCHFAASTDGGATWEEREAPRLEPFTDCGFGAANPTNIRTQLDQGPDGTLYFLFHASDPDAGGARSVLLGQSDDGGESWDTNVVHDPGTARPRSDVELNFVPHMAVDPDDADRVVVVWRRSYDTVGDKSLPTRPWMAISDDGGETFGEPFKMVDEDIGFEAPKLEIVDGQLVAFYRLRPEEGDNQVVAATSDDDGATWDETVITSADDVSEPVSAYDPVDGVFHLVWHDNSNGDLDAFHASSSDASEWTEPVRLNDDPLENRIGQFYPVVSVAPDGRVDVAWYDYRDDPHPAPTVPEDGTLNLFNNMGKHQSVYTTSSTDGGNTWSPNVRVNDVRIDRTYGPWDPNFFTQVPPAIASAADGPLVAWSDTRRGDAGTGSQDLVTAQVDLTGESSNVLLVGVLAGLAGLLLGGGGALTLASVTLRRTRSDGSEPGVAPAT